MFTRQNKNRLLYLLGAILLLIVLYPYLRGGMIQTALMNLLTSAILVISAYVLSYDKKPFIFALLLGIPALATTWMNMLFTTHPFPYASYCFTIAFYFFTLFTILAYVLKSNKVTAEEIYGVICVYLLIGITWGMLFSLTEELHPGSFKTAHGSLEWPDFMYFSFTTLTTAGYGDIVPSTARAQSLSVLEMIIGVLYVAVLVARLVSLYGGKKHNGL